VRDPVDCMALFMSMPLQTLTQCRVLCVEHDSKLADIVRRTERFGFRYIWHCAQNVILSRD